jgi:serine/threonine-protein kinase
MSLTFDWVTVPAGLFLMGSRPPNPARPYPDEAPQHTLWLPGFALSRTLVTNAQYAVFVRATGRLAPGHWLGGQLPPGREDYPVTYVGYEDAMAFCRWAGGRLPSEAEWEKAARGEDGRTWPWGDTPPNDDLCNYGNRVGDTTAVDRYSAGASPYGALDMAGNVWEWTASLYQPYPYDALDGREATRSQERRVVRGGTYIHPPRLVRCADRHALYPVARDMYLGFRVASDYIITSLGGVDLDWVYVPAGEFLMGNDTTDDGEDVDIGGGSQHGAKRPADFDNELPQHSVDVAEFRIARTPVTNAQYAAFVAATGHPPPGHWPDRCVPDGQADHPVIYVDWQDAHLFCQWAGVRLPTEAEWEKAARGTDGRAWPWGRRAPDPTLANFGGDMKYGATTPVGQFPAGASPYGALDMGGNVWEWTSTVYRPYPYQADDGREDDTSPEERVLRGGAFLSANPRYLRCATRSMSYPSRRREHIGFRVVAL